MPPGGSPAGGSTSGRVPERPRGAGGSGDLPREEDHAATQCRQGQQVEQRAGAQGQRP